MVCIVQHTYTCTFPVNKLINSCQKLFFLFPNIDKPGPPRQLTVSDVTSESAYVTWQKPEDDGGAVISHYVVEKKDVAAAKWVPVSASSKKLSLMALYLMEGVQYLFRVAAENQFGKSAYTETNKPIKALDPLCKYKCITKDLLIYCGEIIKRLSVSVFQGLDFKILKLIQYC